jgi:hypothetical protein
MDGAGRAPLQRRERLLPCRHRHPATVEHDDALPLRRAVDPYGPACHDRMMRLLAAVAVLAALVRCNARARPGLPDDGAVTPEDAEASAPPADAPFPCGPQPGLTCAPNQYCLVGCTDEGPISCLPRLDSGVCPPNSLFSRGCDLEAAPCELDDLSSFPTMCFDDIDASPCGGPDPASALEDRTIYCACTL